MALLVVRGRGTRLCWRRGYWRVERGGAEIRSLLPRDVSEVQCWGPVEIEAGARAAALARGVPLVFFTADGRYRGRLDGPRAPIGALRVAQARWLGDEGSALRLAKDIVLGKIAASRALVLRAQRRRQADLLAAVACSLRAQTRRLEGAADLAALRGHEGAAADRYFDAFPELILNADFPWRGRSRRPPRDPINACLSFGYTLLASRVESAIRAVGLLPGLGALHAPGPGRAPLVYDLVEEFRAPVVDRAMLRLVNRKQLAPADFEDPALRRPTFAPPMDADEGGQQRRSGSGAVYLGSTARKLVLAEFSRTMRGELRDDEDRAQIRTEWLLERQARRLARVFLGREERYRPFRWASR